MGRSCAQPAADGVTRQRIIDDVLWQYCILAAEEIGTMLWSEEYFELRAPGVNAVDRLGLDTVKEYADLSSAAHKRDLLGAKNRELIALVVAVTARSNGCVTDHADAALRHGATRQEIAEALRVAAAVNAGVRQQKRTADGQDRALPLDREVSCAEEGRRPRVVPCLEIAAAPGIQCADAQRSGNAARMSGDNSRIVVCPGMQWAPDP
jgi:AhpD family alkylhydroperoxidase